MPLRRPSSATPRIDTTPTRRSSALESQRARLVPGSGWVALPNGHSSTKPALCCTEEMPFAQLPCSRAASYGRWLRLEHRRREAGDSVVIFGAGGVGLNAVSGALIAGASRIVVIDIQQKRLDAAGDLGRRMSRLH